MHLYKIRREMVSIYNLILIFIGGMLIMQDQNGQSIRQSGVKAVLVVH